MYFIKLAILIFGCPRDRYITNFTRKPLGKNYSILRKDAIFHIYSLYICKHVSLVSYIPTNSSTLLLWSSSVVIQGLGISPPISCICRQSNTLIRNKILSQRRGSDLINCHSGQGLIKVSVFNHILVLIPRQANCPPTD